MNKKIAIILGCSVLLLALSIVTKGKILTIVAVGALIYFAYKNN